MSRVDRMARRLGIAPAAGVALVLALAGCGTGTTMILQPTQQPGGPQPVYASLSVRPGQSPIFVPPDAANLFASKLEAKIYGQGSIAHGDDLTLTYQFVAYDEGSRLERYIVGASGFGEGSISVQAVFTDRSGRQIGQVVSIGRISHGLFGGDFDLAIDQAAKEVAGYTFGTFRIAGYGPPPPPQMSPRGVAQLPNQPVAGGVRADGPPGLGDAIGREFRDSVPIGSARVPLLDGTWLLAGSGGAGASQYAASFVRIDDGRLYGIIRVWVTARPVSGGYAAFAQCNRTNVAFTSVASNVDHGDQDCWLINHYDMVEARANSTQRHELDSYAFLDARGVAVPLTMIVGIHRIATPTRSITVWYQVNPELAGFPAPASSTWRDSDWYRDRLGQDPRRVAYVETFKQQHARYHELLREGFQQSLVSTAP